jgi:hypothetical protein
MMISRRLQLLAIIITGATAYYTFLRPTPLSERMAAYSEPETTAQADFDPPVTLDDEIIEEAFLDIEEEIEHEPEAMPMMQEDFVIQEEAPAIAAAIGEEPIEVIEMEPAAATIERVEEDMPQPVEPMTKIEEIPQDQSDPAIFVYDTHTPSDPSLDSPPPSKGGTAWLAMLRLQEDMTAGRPYRSSLQQLKLATRDPIIVDEYGQLEAYAASGIGDYQQLKDQFHLLAFKQAPEDAPRWQKLLSPWVTIRKVGQEHAGHDSGSIFARVEGQLYNREIDLALTELERLPNVTRARLQSWIADVQTYQAAMQSLRRIQMRLETLAIEG